MANEEIPDDLGEMSWSEIQSVVAKVKYQLDNSRDQATDQLLHERLVEARAALAEIESRWEEDGEADAPVPGEPVTPSGGPAPDTAEIAPNGTNGAAPVGRPATAGPAPSSEDAELGSADSIDELLAELLVDDATEQAAPDADAAGPEGEAQGPDLVTEAEEPDPEVIEAAIITARGKPRSRPSPAAAPPAIGGPQPGAHRLHGPEQPAAPAAPARQITTAWWVVGAFVLTALAGTLGFILIGSGDGSDDGGVLSAAAPTNELEEFRQVLDVLDAGGLDVEWEGSVLRISGTVASTDQLEVVRDTAAVMVDYEELDTSGVTVDEPVVVVAGESATATETDRLQPKLQQDLGRLLQTTPIMFGTGESELGELDRRILNAAVVLILSAPEARITIIGHPDGANVGADGGALATARATAVRDYLIVRGVDPEVLSSEGQATLAPDGAPGVIELVVDP